MAPPKGKSTLGRRIRESFYEKHESEPETWVCICGTTRKQSGTGYSNLISHIQNKNPEEFQRIREIDDAHRNGIYSETSKTSFQTGKSFLDIEGKATYFYDTKVLSVHGWIGLVVNALLPFTIEHQSTLRRHVKYSQTEYKTKFAMQISVTTYDVNMSRKTTNSSCFNALAIVLSDQQF